MAKLKLVESRECVKAGQWANAISALELGLKNREVFAEPQLLAELEQELARTVRERPFTSLALAVGAGFLIALATRR